MKFNYELYFTRSFLSKIRKLYKKNPSIKKKVDMVFRLMQIDPFDSKLKTHKFTSRIHGLTHSSKITKDLRVIWNFDNKIPTILDILDIGDHSGSKKVYK